MPCEHEQEIRQTVEIHDHPLADVLVAREAHNRTLRPPADRAGEVETRRKARSSGKYETMERLQEHVKPVDLPLQPEGIAGFDPLDFLLPSGRPGRGQIGPQGEELVLDLLEDRPDSPAGPSASAIPSTEFSSSTVP
jgi:hypothetical protein